MANRYIPSGPFACMDKNGIRRHFNPDHQRQDGTFGYTEDEIDSLYKAHQASFRLITVDGVDLEDEVVERATAAPGEKRVTKSKATE